MRVAFFQRIFAHYQAGLVKELAEHSQHAYHFFGDGRDPAGSGIEVIAPALCGRIPFTYCHTTQIGSRVAFQWRAVREALFGPFDVYILEGSFTCPTNWLAIWAAHLRGRRVLLYGHGWRRPGNGFAEYVRRMFYRVSDGLLLYGNRAHAIGLSKGVSADRMYVVYNSLDEESMLPWRDRLTENICQDFRCAHFGKAADLPLLVSVGRLTPAKQYELLIEAAARLHAAGREVNILLVGDGPKRLALEQAAREKGVRLVLEGARHDEEFLSLCFASADIAVIPGAAGLMVIQSLSYGTPVVIHDDDDEQGPETEAVHSGFNGGLFRYGCVDHLVTIIEQVLASLPRGSKTAEQCRTVIFENYNPSHMREVFDRAVSGLPAVSFQPSEVR